MRSISAKIAKALLTEPERIKYTPENEIYITSFVCYDNNNTMVMAQNCPLCGYKHVISFTYVDSIAQIKCPATGVKIYGIYA